MSARLLLAALAVAVALPQAARALETLESIFMPGPVTRAHAKWESQCTSCHRPFDRRAEDGLCLDCHEEVAADRAAGEGFHSRAPGIQELACRSCHTEHLGREADVVGLRPARFDHDATDYPLRGAHTAVACGRCHEPAARHRAAPADCVACHREDDAHAGALGEGCGDCHGEAGWAEARFDHGTTRFPLEGGHEGVACSACHADQHYEGTPSACGTCHRLDDAHEGRFGSACDSCHVVQSWATARFDHARDTSFPLVGRHASAPCASCHGGSLHDPVPSDCVSCHRADDVHRGGQGAACGDCHTATAWREPRFDHGETDFLLRGAHAEAACEACHVGGQGGSGLAPAQDCVSCHRDDDVHGGQEGARCGTCHGEESWNRGVVFDHDLSGFPLLGLHATLSCESCHVTSAFRDARTGCETCHAAQDPHDGRLGAACATCHTPNGWQVWRFDHDTAASFPLHGAHEALDCLSCHTEPARAASELPRDCGPCHASDDRHRGAFGSDCARCHVDEAWGEVHLP